ncbi:O-antigen ligase family protein [Neobacillus bataviensis]|uniref:O-antigen ligase family protein n=1 Tax=Neobacillus bataviensis TaxID=220685 RepID=UPI001CBED219|nr:O-antigen ligase family protein [Neobacillus bataviensis]
MKINNIKEKENIKIITMLLAFYLFLAPLDFLPVIPGVSVSRFLILIPLGVSIFYLKNMKIRLDKFLIIPILYVMVVMVTMFYSHDLSETIQRTISIGQNIGVIIILSLLSYNRTEIRLLKRAIVFSGWLTLLLMYFYSDTQSILGGRLTVSVNGVYQDPNYLTGFLIFSIMFYFEDLIKNRSKASIVKLGVFLIFVLLTGSRGGFLAIVGSILIYSLIWTRTKKFKPSSLIILISFILIMSTIFNIALNMLPETVAQRYDASYSLNDNAAGRGDIWESLIFSYEQSPGFNKFFGWGAGTIRYFTYNGNVAHNIWLESLIEIGVIGVLMLFILYFSYIRKAFKLKEYVMATCFIGYMIMAMSMSLYSYKPIWNIILLIMILKNNHYEVNKLFKKGIINL